MKPVPIFDAALLAPPPPGWGRETPPRSGTELSQVRHYYDDYYFYYDYDYYCYYDYDYDYDYYCYYYYYYYYYYY